MKTYIASQECSYCGEQFRVEYAECGGYRFIDFPCECEVEFSPVDGEPSISQWLEYIGK